MELVANYLNSLPAGARSTAATYETWRRQNPGVPATDRFGQHGGWDAVRRKALTRNAHALTEGAKSRGSDSQAARPDTNSDDPLSTAQ